MISRPDDESSPRPAGQGLTAPTARPNDGPWALLARLVVRDGVGLGGLPAVQRSLVLAWVWAGLPAASVVDERQVNEWLKAQLAGPASFLDTDHVELRRWLVDAGWLARDGWGRQYRRVDAGSLAPGHRPMAEAVARIDTAAWVADVRAAHRTEREARRRAWRAGLGAGP